MAGADDTGAALHQRQFPDLARMALMGGSSISGVPEVGRPGARTYRGVQIPSTIPGVFDGVVRLR